MTASKQEKLFIISGHGNSGQVSASKYLEPFLDDPDSEVAGSACFYLGYLGARKYMKDILTLLQLNDETLLISCTSGLALMVDSRDEELLGQLHPLIEHESLLVRLSVIQGIGNIGSKISSNILLSRFDLETLAVKTELVMALGKIGSDDALPILREFLNAVSKMDHSIPRKASVRGMDPHPDVIERVTSEAILLIETSK